MPYNYNINWNRFAALNIANELRKVKFLRYVIALLEPIQRLYYDFIDFRLEQIYESEITGQVFSLERMLNDRFDPIDRRIYIDDGEYYEAPVFYEEYKNRPVVFYAEGNTENPVFYSTDELGDRVSVNFIVHVPAEVFFEKDRVRANVVKYKNDGRTFDIVII